MKLLIGFLFQFINGGSLESILANKEHDLPWEQRINFACDIASGMSHLHSKEVMHRDLTSKVIQNCVLLFVRYEIETVYFYRTFFFFLFFNKLRSHTAVHRNIVQVVLKILEGVDVELRRGCVERLTFNRKKRIRHADITGFSKLRNKQDNLQEDYFNLKRIYTSLWSKISQGEDP